jgi:radical SAM family protein
MENLAAKTSSLLRKIGATLLTAKARLRGQGFVCDSVQGTASIGVCINSDLTLSCGCRDYDGSGHVGDLRECSLEDAFLGPTARSFREQLADGRLPTSNCTRCMHLRMISKHDAQRLLHHVTMPVSVLLENTSACNLRCVSCRRDTVKRLRKRRTMSLDDVRKVAEDLQRIGVEEITFHNLGEPFLSKRLLEELTIIRECNPGVRLQVSTNGMFVDTDRKREAALLFDHIQFSLDGIDQDMVARYQRGLDFDKVFRNLKNLVAYRDAGNHSRPRIVWKYLLFRWNERRKYRLSAIDMAREAGVDELWFEKTVSPFYGLPWRSYLGFNRDLGVDRGFARHVIFREEPSPTPAVEPPEIPIPADMYR